MNLTLLKARIYQYLSQIDQRTEALEDLYQQQQQYVTNWDLTLTDINAMIGRAANMGHQLWTRPNYFPIESLLSYATYGPEMVRDSFKDLYAEHKDFSGRVNRFLFHMNWLEKNSQESTYKKKPHYHNESTVFQYLSFCYPQKYALYDSRAFDQFLNDIAAKKESNLPQLERFVKASGIVLKIFKSEWGSHNFENIQFQVIYSQYPMLLVSDLMGTVNSYECK